MKGNTTGTLIVIGIAAALGFSAFGPAGIIAIGLVMLMMMK